MKKTILLTGVAGFVGQRTAENLLKEGFKVVGVDNMNDYYDIRIKEYRLNLLKGIEGFSFYKIDIQNFESCERVFSEYQFDAVINLAARAGVGYSLLHPHIYYATNTLATVNLLELCKNKGVKKFVLASTSSLYAGEKMPFLESLSVNTPISPYAASKKGAELACYPYYDIYGIDISIVRYFTVYGPAGRPDMSIFRFIKWISEGTHIELFGDGKQSRDFTYISDIASGTVKALKDTGYEIINLGGGQIPYSLNDVISLIEDNLGKKAKIDYKPKAKVDISSTSANIDKAKNILDWEPKVGIEDGIKETVMWYLANKEWLKDIKM